MRHNTAEKQRAGAGSSALLNLSNVQKSFGTNLVLDGVNFDLEPGEIHALVGENGAGKSTCLGLMYGLHQPSAGKVLLNGSETKIENPSDAQDQGVGCVFQELSLAGGLSVAENIFAGRAPSRFGIVNWTELHKRAEALLAEFDLSIDVTKPVDSLPISTRQVVEIVKAISLNSRVLLLDEPTSALTPDEVDALFKVLRKLTARGIGIVYVSHHMSEIFTIADRISVLRDGKKISTKATSDTTQVQVVSEMIGGAHPGDVDRSDMPLGQTILSVKGLCAPGEFQNVTFDVRAGEIVGMAGLLGSRRSEIMRAIVGLSIGHTGQIILEGDDVRFASLRAAMKQGVGYVPEERKTEGLFLDETIGSNISAASLAKHSLFGVVRKQSIQAVADHAISSFSIKARGAGDRVGALSGGNQQKVMLAKWLERTPKLLIIEEPTKGVDVGAKFQIHTELKRCAAQGMAIIVVSSDFPELVSLCSRILVVHEGRVMGDVSAQNASEDSLLHMASGFPDSSTNARPIQAPAIPVQHGAQL